MSSPANNQSQGPSPFDSFRRTRADGSEFWSAREVLAHLGYKNWQNINSAVKKAKSACRNIGEVLKTHFEDIAKPPARGGPPTADTLLSRFALYLVVMGGHTRKPGIAAAQAYFVRQVCSAETLLSPITEARPA